MIPAGRSSPSPLGSPYHRWDSVSISAHRLRFTPINSHAGLMIMLNETSSRITETVFPLICGVGLGMLFHAPYQVFTKTLKPKELASGTSAFFLVRFSGATVGLVSLNDRTMRNIRSSKRHSPLQAQFSKTDCRKHFQRCLTPRQSL